MAKKPKPQFKELYVGEWIEATGYEQMAVVRATKVSQPYISNLSGGRRGNPSAHILRLISEFIGVTIDDLYRPPPRRSDLEAMGRYSEAAQEALLKQTRKQA